MSGLWQSGVLCPDSPDSPVSVLAVSEISPGSPGIRQPVTDAAQ